MTDQASMADYGIDKRCLLVKVSIPGASSKRKNKKLTDEVAKSTNADVDMISAVIDIMPKEFIDNLNRLRTQLRDENNRLTAAWYDDGWRIMTLEMMDKHSDAMERIIPQYHAEADRIVENLPAIVEAARLRLGDAFDESMYPTQNELRQKLRVVVRHKPIPKGHDFRLQLDANSLEFLKAKLEDDLMEGVKVATQSLRDRMVDAVSTFIDRLEKVKNYIDPATGKPRVSGFVRSSITKNLEALVEVIPGLNITNDEDINSMARELRRKLCAFTSDALNDSPHLRDAVIADARKILSKLKS